MKSFQRDFHLASFVGFCNLQILRFPVSTWKNPFCMHTLTRKVVAGSVLSLQNEEFNSDIFTFHKDVINFACNGENCFGNFYLIIAFYNLFSMSWRFECEVNFDRFNQLRELGMSRTSNLFLFSWELLKSW